MSEIKYKINRVYHTITFTEPYSKVLMEDLNGKEGIVEFNKPYGLVFTDRDGIEDDTKFIFPVYTYDNYFFCDYDLFPKDKTSLSTRAHKYLIEYNEVCKENNLRPRSPSEDRYCWNCEKYISEYLNIRYILQRDIRLYEDVISIIEKYI